MKLLTKNSSYLWSEADLFLNFNFERKCWASTVDLNGDLAFFNVFGNGFVVDTRLDYKIFLWYKLLRRRVTSFFKYD